MAPSLSDILVISDMDGTLVNPGQTISPCDIETVKLFTLLGGNFAVATGRVADSVKLYPALAKVLHYGITAGGSLLYDFKQNKVAQAKKLPHLAARQALRNIMEAFPALGVMITDTEARLYQVRPSEHLDGLIENEEMSFLVRPNEYIPDAWAKVLFAGAEPMLQEVEEYTKQTAYPGVYFVRSHKYYFEIMPKGVSKGSALHDLCRLMGIPVKNTYVIGDYYNDLEIMKQAGYAVAMANAPKEVRVVAREITGSNANGGVGQFLYKLIREYAPL